MLFNFFRKKEKVPETGKSLAEKLEAAKQKLISELQTKGMKFLVIQMSRNEDYSELISERRKISLSYGSQDSISWYAFCQSDKVNSASDKEELLSLLADSEYFNLKTNIYRCLSSLCSNTNDRELFNFLIEKVVQEDDESTKVSILSRLSSIHKDASFNIGPIKELVKEGSNHVSHAAIKALSYTKDPEVEDILLDEFKITDKHMKAMICLPLSTIGTLKSIPILKDAYKKTRDGFLRSSIDETIYKIEKRERGEANAI